MPAETALALVLMLIGVGLWVWGDRLVAWLGGLIDGWRLRRAELVRLRAMWGE